MIARLLILVLAMMVVVMPVSSPAAAHPEDEFCTPGEDGLDPALCRALAELDSASKTADLSADAEEIRLEDLDRSALGTVAVYIQIGFQHIVPGGLDHILFVLALFLSTRRLGPLLWQVSAFTLAHTVTLGLTAAGVLSPPSSWVEPLIALTIAWAAIENLLFDDAARWRPLLVFVFGLIHGMGFAGAFAELGLPDGMFWPALFGFNIGVELGQIAVIGMAFAAAFAIRGALKRVSDGDIYRRVIVWPGSALIAATGLWWAVQRTFF
jgi:hypothetical protein